MKYKIGDSFYLDGQKAISNEWLFIFSILKPNFIIHEAKYLCICKRDIASNGTFNDIFYSIMDDETLENFGYKLQ